MVARVNIGKRPGSLDLGKLGLGLDRFGLGKVVDILVAGVFAPGDIVAAGLRPHTMMMTDVDPRDMTCNYRGPG
jgi:hypothetical protein